MTISHLTKFKFGIHINWSYCFMRSYILLKVNWLPVRIACKANTKYNNRYANQRNQNWLNRRGKGQKRA